MSIAAALAELQTQLPPITKDLTAKVKSERTGTQYSYSYADLAMISREVLPILGKLGLSFTARPTLRGERFVLAYELHHVSGESLAGEYPLPDRGTPQEIGGAITYARRYCLCAVTGVAPEDDDNDAALAEKAARRDARKKAAPSNGVTAQQNLRMQQLFKELGMTDRDAKLGYAREVVGRDLGSATELTGVEADKVIARLESWAAQEQPPADGAA